MLSEFLNFNKTCPLCGNNLHLYMRWVDSMLFKATVEDSVYMFDPIITKDNQAGFKSESMMLDMSDGIKTEFTSKGLEAEAKKHQIYFFFICNEKAIKSKSWGEYEISVYNACYYRSTVFFEFKHNPDIHAENWVMNETTEDSKLLINKDECCCFTKKVDDVERIYMLNLEREKKETMLWHYTVSDEQKKQQGFRPTVFEKMVPLLTNRPDLSPKGREKLIERFDNWILMS